MDESTGILMERYQIGRKLGQGGFGKVYYASRIENGESVAIKVIDKERMEVGMQVQIKREISAMSSVPHPHIVNIYEVMATKTKVYIVMEYIKGGDLFEKVSKGKLDEDVARKYFQQLINAVEFCHSKGVYHRDLKPENILLDENDNIKVSDFGLSVLSTTKQKNVLLHTMCGTPEYVAPEVLEGNGYYGCKADIWCCGVILYVLLAGISTFPDPVKMYRKIRRPRENYPSWFSNDARDLIYALLDPDPFSRISIPSIKDSDWFKQGLISTTTNHQPDNDGIPGEEVEPNISDMNAFDIICLASQFDSDKEARFISRKPATVIISKLKTLARQLKWNMKKKTGGCSFKLEGREEGREGILAIDTEIFALAPDLHLVEMKKTSGDTLEYKKILCETIRPGLQDIIDSWQGESKGAHAFIMQVWRYLTKNVFSWGTN